MSPEIIPNPPISSLPPLELGSAMLSYHSISPSASSNDEKKRSTLSVTTTSTQTNPSISVILPTTLLTIPQTLSTTTTTTASTSTINDNDTQNGEIFVPDSQPTPLTQLTQPMQLPQLTQVAIPSSSSSFTSSVKKENKNKKKKKELVIEKIVTQVTVARGIQRELSGHYYLFRQIHLLNDVLMCKAKAGSNDDEITDLTNKVIELQRYANQLIPELIPLGDSEAASIDVTGPPSPVL